MSTEKLCTDSASMCRACCMSNNASGTRALQARELCKAMRVAHEHRRHMICVKQCMDSAGVCCVSVCVCRLYSL
jgi:hypothetical protein